MFQNGEDCLLPTKTLQTSPSPVIGNQVIVHTICLDHFHDLVQTHHEIVKHFDESDHNAINLLIFLRINLDDKDQRPQAMVMSQGVIYWFLSRTNGWSMWSNLNYSEMYPFFVPRANYTVCKLNVIIMTTKMMAIAIQFESFHTGNNRLLILSKITKRYNGGPSSFVGIKPRLNKQHDIQVDLHKPLDLCDVAIGQEAAVHWG